MQTSVEKNGIVLTTDTHGGEAVSLRKMGQNISGTQIPHSGDTMHRYFFHL